MPWQNLGFSYGQTVYIPTVGLRTIVAFDNSSYGDGTALIVGTSNGIVGYVPHREAFPRGGYETTFLGTSKMAPEAGDLLVDAAVQLIQGS